MSKTATKKISGSPIEKAQVSEPENIICHEFEPDDSVISNILNYSRSLSVQKSQNIDHIEVVLN